jgi:hypothetical protein
MKYLILVAALLASACGSSSPAAPTAAAPPPPPAPTANIVATAQGNWTSCLPAIGGFAGACSFQGEATNSGAGCAIDVRGVTRFYNSASVQLGTTAAWTLTGSRIVRPGESFAYLTSSEDLPTVNAVSTYQTQPSWTNVACQ